MAKSGFYFNCYNDYLKMDKTCIKCGDYTPNKAQPTTYSGVNE